MDWNALIEFWQHLPERIDPVLFRAGPFQLRYYGLMYLAAFGTAYAVAAGRIRRGEYSLSVENLQSYCLWAVVGILAGGRLGYILIYEPAYYLSNPVRIVFPFYEEGGTRWVGFAGMSYHGGVAGWIAVTWAWTRKRRHSFLAFTDFILPGIPLGYTFGRIGNFLNGELYGRPTGAPWGMYFPADPTGELRHPSQLYEAFLEGLVLYAVLRALTRVRAFPGFTGCAYLAGYGILRFAAEFFREPDPGLGLVWAELSTGQLLCGIMTGAALLTALFLRQRARTPDGRRDASDERVKET